MFLSNEDVTDLVDWRRRLHRSPELSGQEVETAREVVAFLTPTRPDEIVRELGGHGVAVVYRGAEPGPTVMFRAELDGLPIEEISTSAHRSAVAGKGHLCGHDGHMATLAALARGLGRQRPRRGRAVLMFQPAEENGSGAAAVIADSRFQAIAPDIAFAYHNMPGIKLGQAAIAAGPANCASCGMRITLSGKTAHAASPEHGISPMRTIASLMPSLASLGTGGTLDSDFAMVTLTHVSMGEAAFGIAPGYAEIWTTLRSLTSTRMEQLRTAAETLVRQTAIRAGLRIAISYHDVFAPCENAPQAVDCLRRAIDAEGVPHDSANLPMRGSEDFGRFGENAPAAMFLLGAGEQHPGLHNPDYDFPDELITVGARVMMRTLRDLLG